MRRIVAKWTEGPDAKHKTKRMLVSPVYFDQESKTAAIQWMAEHLEKEPIGLRHAKYETVEEPAYGSLSESNTPVSSSG